jgi:hypothetical protein
MTPPMTPQTDAAPRLRTARVLRVEEDACEVWSGGVVGVGFAPMFPSPRVERISPGHLVAVASDPNGTELVVWRWFDAVVLGTEEDGSVRLWEPAHGEVVAQARSSYAVQEPGSRAYASAGLPGAEWWVAGDADAAELHAVDSLYTDNGLWPAVFATNAG